MKKISLVGVALIALAMAGCKEKKTEAVVEQKPLVKVMAAVSSEVEQLVEFTGTIDPYVQNAINPSMPVRIDQIMVEVDTKVQKGQLLVKMDQTQYKNAKLQLADQEANYQRTKAVYDVNGVSQQQMESYTTSLEVAKATVSNLLENIELRSPITGIITARNYDNGDMYSGVQPILTVMQMDRLKVKINISESYFPNVKVGMPVDIKLDIYPGETFKGTVSLIYPAINAATRTFTVEVTVPNGNMKLRPGMFARVALNFGSAERVMIPDLSVQKQVGTNERFVYIVRNNTAERRVVDLGRQVGDRYEVLSGVAEGEQVAVAGMSRLMDGTEVEINNN